MNEFDSEILIGKHLDSLLLQKYINEVLQANSRFNLCSRNLDQADLRLMVAESLIPIELELIDSANAKFLDIGSGWGIPALPFLMADQNLDFTLLERSMKKADFLRLLLQRLKIKAAVAGCDLKQFDEVNKFAFFTLRRVAIDDKLLRDIKRISSDNACLIYFGAQLPAGAFSSIQTVAYSIDRLPERFVSKASIS